MTERKHLAKSYKEAMNYLEYVSKLCKIDVDIRFHPRKNFPTETTNRWRVKVLGTNFIDDNFIVAAASALEFITNAYPEKFKIDKTTLK